MSHNQKQIGRTKYLICIDESPRWRVNHKGKKFGRLTVVRKVDSLMYLCRCDCGVVKEVRSCALTSGHTQSCGCINKEQATLLGKSKKSHGKRHSRVYGIFTDMHTRCYNTKAVSYPRYGGRGIKVCTEWFRNFEQFYADMGDPPSTNHSLDREDNSKDYAKDNCRWATAREQACNTRRNVHVTYNGQQHVLFVAIKLAGIPPYMVQNRRNRLGMSPQEAFDDCLQKKILDLYRKVIDNPV